MSELEPVRLSEAGLARREAMLNVLGDAMMARVTRRRRVRASGVAVAVVLAGVAAMIANRLAGSTAPVMVSGPAMEAPALTMQHAAFREVRTDPEIVEGGGRIVIIDDAKLLRELRAMGHPTGLIRTHGSVVLTADVTSKGRTGGGVPGNG